MNGKRLLLFLIIGVISFSLSACGSSKSSATSGMPKLSTSNDDTIATTCFEKIIESLENKNKGELKEMFSPNALKEANDIDGNTEYIMNFYKGKIKSKISGLQASDLNEHGSIKRELRCMYIVTTDVDKYIVFFIYEKEDTNNPDNVGLYMLQIIKESDKSKEFDWGGAKTKCVGIYRPNTIK